MRRGAVLSALLLTALLLYLWPGLLKGLWTDTDNRMAGELRPAQRRTLTLWWLPGEMGDQRCISRLCTRLEKETPGLRVFLRRADAAELTAPDALLPDAVLFAVTAILSSFMLSGELPAIRGWLRRTVRPAWLEKLQTLGGHVRTTLGGWLRAQLKLMGITFLILNAGLLLLRVRYPVLAALVITVVDALPVFGTGTILIPWALALFLQGETKTGIGLVILYGAAALSRQALEPRLVGKQVGLNPVLTLLALYTGYRLLGVGGMIVFPIAAMLFKQLWDHSGLQPDG